MLRIMSGLSQMAALEHEVRHDESDQEFSESGCLIHAQNHCHSGLTFITIEGYYIHNNYFRYS